MFHSRYYHGFVVDFSYLQTQANRFIKNMGKASDQGFEVCKLTDGNFMREVELAVQFGKWILIENVTETLDPALEPILLQQKIKDSQGIP